MLTDVQFVAELDHLHKIISRSCALTVEMGTWLPYHFHVSLIVQGKAFSIDHDFVVRGEVVSVGSIFYLMKKNECYRCTPAA
jgi:hypothetical protein